MSIAVIGWGSLIWCPRELALRSPWRADGPCLPVEFARKSRDGRVTLVLTQGSKTVRTYWALSWFDELDKAIENLRSREGTTKKWIHSLSPRGGEECDTIAEWLEEMSDLDGAVWTALEPTFPIEGLEEFVVSYLNGLPEPWLTRSREYVEFAPRQIITPVREAIEDALGWKRMSLPPQLFDGSDIAGPCDSST